MNKTGESMWKPKCRARNMMSLGCRWMYLYLQMCVETLLPGTIRKNSPFEAGAGSCDHRMGVYIIPGKISMDIQIHSQEEWFPQLWTQKPLWITSLETGIPTLSFSVLQFPHLEEGDNGFCTVFWLNNIPGMTVLQKGIQVIPQSTKSSCLVV